MKFFNYLKNHPAPLEYILLLFFFAEIFTKVFYYKDYCFFNVSALIKGIFILYVAIYSLYNLTSNRKKGFYFLVIFLVIFLVGNFFFKGERTFFNTIFYNIKYFLRYILIFVLYIFCDGFYNKKFNVKLFKLYEYIVIGNSLLIILGFIFKLDVLSTYRGTRFGYNGLFLVPSIATYFYCIALIYYSHKIMNKAKGYLVFFLLIISASLIGTKAVLLFLAFVIFTLFIYYKLYRKKTFYMILALSIAIVLFLREYIFNVLITTYDVLYDVYENNGVITMLTSYRDLKFINEFPSIFNERMSWINYLFGGTDFSMFRIEFELVDIFLFFGIIGSLLYFRFYFKNIIVLKYFNRISVMQLIFLLFTACLSGTFFNNGAVGLYLIIVINYIIKEDLWVKVK